MNKKAIGENVKFWRDNKKMTQTELAKRAFTTQQNISRLEKGDIMPPLETLKSIADALDVTMPELYNDESKPDYFTIDVTSRYIERMNRETPDVQAVMHRALEGNGKIRITLLLSKCEQEMYKQWRGDLNAPIRFWEFLDEGSLENGLNLPAEYVWCLKKLDEYHGNKTMVRKAWFKKMMKRHGLKTTVGLPHIKNVPWLYWEDYLRYMSLLGFMTDDIEPLISGIKKKLVIRR